jgi:hypothetical protein
MLKDRGHFRDAITTVLQIEGLMNLLSLVNEETEFQFIGEGTFLESIGAVGAIGAKLAVEALEDINHAENRCQDAPETNLDAIGLPELVSAVLTHSDAPEWFTKGIGELISENNAIDPHSAEYIAVALGLEVKE